MHCLSNMFESYHMIGCEKDGCSSKCATERNSFEAKISVWQQRNSSLTTCPFFIDELWKLG